LGKPFFRDNRGLASRAEDPIRRRKEIASALGIGNLGRGEKKAEKPIGTREKRAWVKGTSLFRVKISPRGGGACLDTTEEKGREGGRRNAAIVGMKQRRERPTPLL